LWYNISDKKEVEHTPFHLYGFNRQVNKSKDGAVVVPVYVYFMRSFEPAFFYYKFYVLYYGGALQ